MGNSLLDNGISVKWVDEELAVESVEQGYRKNVCQYDRLGNKIEYQGESDNKSITLGKKRYCQCARKWRFRVKEEKCINS